MLDVPRHTVKELSERGLLRVEDGNHGEYRPRKDEFVESGVAFIRAADLGDAGIDFDAASKINQVARARITKGVGEPGDVILSHKGTVGKVAIAPLNAPPFVCSPQTTFWRSLDQQELDQEFLYAFIRSPEFRAQLDSRAGETDMAGYVSLTAQRTFLVPLPPIGIQREISSYISAIDRKINLNRRMNETLEAMARVIFKDWFVDFGPTRAKAEGHLPYLVPEIWGLFPDNLDDEEKPLGWEIKPLNDCLERLKVGKLYDQKSVKPDGRIPVLDQGKSGIIGFHNNEPNISASAQRRVSIFANHTCLQRLIDFDFSTIQNVIPFVGRNLPTEWVHYASLGKQEFEEYRGHWPSFVIHEVPVPPLELAIKFAEFVEPSLTKRSANLIENEYLVQTRDLLIRKLTSGEIRLREAEELAEARA